MKKRVFIAINLPESVKTELSKLLSLCKKINSQPVVRYVKTKGIHLTLHFLGYLDDQQINQVKEIMKNYDFETRKMGSTLDYLFGDINTFDMNMRIAIESLQKGDTQHALSLLNRLKESLKEIHHRAKLVAKEGFELE